MRRQPTIYIVDNEPQVLEAIGRLVEPIGANVETFSRAEIFLGKFRDRGPACLVSELRLPGMSGLELQSKLNQMGCRIPIIFLTGYTDTRTVVAAMKAGGANVFEKPFRPRELIDEIQKTLRRDSEAWQRRDLEQDIERELAFLLSGERHVLERIAEGATNDEMARELQLSIRGAETALPMRNK
jgi:two-component system, LuxR family, response regulator FixJ